jgi:chromosome segregation ATPase
MTQQLADQVAKYEQLQASVDEMDAQYSSQKKAVANDYESRMQKADAMQSYLSETENAFLGINDTKLAIQNGREELSGLAHYIEQFHRKLANLERDIKKNNGATTEIVRIRQQLKEKEAAINKRERKIATKRKRVEKEKIRLDGVEQTFDEKERSTEGKENRVHLLCQSVQKLTEANKKLQKENEKLRPLYAFSMDDNLASDRELITNNSLD